MSTRKPKPIKRKHDENQEGQEELGPEKREKSEPILHATDESNSVKKNRRSKKRKPKSREKQKQDDVFVRFSPAQPTASMKLRSLQELVLWVLGYLNSKPAAFDVKGCDLIERVWVTMIDCLDATAYANNSSQLTSLFDIPQAYPLKIPGNKSVFILIYFFQNDRQIRSFVVDAAQDFLHVPLESQEEERDQELSIEQCLLSPAQLKENGYARISSASSAELWILTGPASQDQFPTFAIDCEMCDTRNGPELTRLSVVDGQGMTVLDKLVKPHDPIIDYKTKFSGITAEMLADVTYSLDDAKSDLQRILPSNAVLVGHSLENDLKALKLIHERIIDTSLLYGHVRGPGFKSALRYLVRMHLHRDIQHDSHDSVEDAKACLDLLQLKLERGADFGSFRSDEYSLFSVFAKDADVSACMVGRVGCIRSDDLFNAHFLPCASGSDVAKKFRTSFVIKSSTFCCVKLEDLKNVEDTTKAVGEVNFALQSIIENAPPKTLLIFMGAGDMRPAVELYKKRASSRGDGSWTLEDDQQLHRAVTLARTGLCFIHCKL